MAKAFRINKAQFAANLRAAGRIVHGRVMDAGRREGTEILRDIFGTTPPPKGKIALAKLGAKAHRFGFLRFLKQKGRELRNRTGTALRRAGNRIAAALETRKLSRAYHQLIVMDQKRTMKEDLRQFVSDRWWIPQEFAVTHHHGLGSYIYLVSINIGVSAAQFFLGAKALSYANKARKIMVLRKARVALLRGRKLRRAAYVAGRLATTAAKQTVQESDIFEKIDRAVQDTVESHAMKLFDTVGNLFNKTIRV